MTKRAKILKWIGDNNYVINDPIFVDDKKTVFIEELLEEFLDFINNDSRPLDARVKPERAGIVEILANRYSEFLENNGYIDSDWRDETPTAIERFIEIAQDDVIDEMLAEILSNCRVEDGNVVYNPN